MERIGCICLSILGLFFLPFGFSMFPEAMGFAIIGGLIGGFIDGFRKIKKQKEKEEMERQKRLNQDPKLKDDFDPVY